MDETVKAILAGQVRHYVGMGAASLVTIGVLGKGDEASFVQMISGVVVCLLVLAWSWWQKTGHGQVMAALKRVTGRQTAQAAVAAAKAAAPGIAGALLVFLMLSSSAMAQIRKPLLPTPKDVFAQLAEKMRDTTDLQAADMLASAIDAETGKMMDEIGHACYVAMIKFFSSLPQPPAVDGVPGPAAVFERARLLRLRVQAGLPTYLKIGCAPLVQDETQLFIKLAAMVGVTVGSAGFALPVLPGLIP